MVLLRRVNGMARLHSGGFQPVELADHLVDETGTVHAVALAGTAYARGHVYANPRDGAVLPRYRSLKAVGPGRIR